MRSRSGSELAGLVLGAAVEGVWAGGLAAALTGSSGPALFLLAFVVVLAAALSAYLTGRSEGRDIAGPLMALGVLLFAAGVMLVAGRVWEQPSPLWPALRDVAYAAGLTFLGLRLGRRPQSPEEAVRRALGGFALVCAVVAIASTTGPAPGWAAEAVVASLALGGLSVAIVRYQSVSDLLDPSGRLPAWPWLLAVTGALLLVLVGAALLSRAFATLLLPLILETALTVIGAVLRGLSWLLGLIHVHRLPGLRPQSLPTLPAAPAPRDLVGKDTSSFGTALAVAAALVVVVLSAALVLLGLRRVRREPPADVAEEREALSTLTVAAGDLAARLGRRLRRLDPRRLAARTPAERVRRRYAQLEQRLSHSGFPRAAGVTVRVYLEAVARSLPTTGDAAGDLAAIYEQARYSGRSVAAVEEQRFEALARVLQPVRPN